MKITVTEALTLLTVTDLIPLSRLLPGPPLAGRKAELVASIAGAVLGPNLQSLWERLDAMARAAVSEAVHDVQGEFLAQQFQAKYQTGAPFAKANKPTSLGLFIYQHLAGRSVGVPTDLRQRLLAFVPKPAAPQIKSAAALAPVPGQVTRETELDALQELVLMLPRWNPIASRWAIQPVCRARRPSACCLASCHRAIFIPGLKGPTSGTSKFDPPALDQVAGQPCAG